MSILEIVLITSLGAATLGYVIFVLVKFIIKRKKKNPIDESEEIIENERDISSK